MKNGSIRIFLFLLGIHLIGCNGLKFPKKIHFAAKNTPEQVLANPVSYKIYMETSPDKIICEGESNSFGYFMIKSKTLLKIPGQSGKRNRESIDGMTIEVTENNRSSKLRLNRFLPYYDIYLENQNPQIAEKDRIADMHYHISMRNHNTFGHEFHQPGNEKPIPGSLNWLRLHKNLKIYHDGKWRKVDLNKKGTHGEEDEKLKKLLEGKLITGKDGANNLKHYSEATQPHLLEGNVFLAYNAISPFEHSISKTSLKRVISSAFKSGANIKWLKIMGETNVRDHPTFTHWRNFNAEYTMIKQQDSLYNNFNWGHLKKNDDIAARLSKPMVVNVVEGGHILQDQYFPHAPNYDLARRSIKENDRLYEEIKNKCLDLGSPFQGIFDGNNERFTEIYSEIRELRSGNLNSSQVNSKLDIKLKVEDLEYEIQDLKTHLIDSILIKEIIENVDSLKSMDIGMMAISHLSYNGMTGHAPALDVSKKPFLERMLGKVLIRGYGIRTSSDKRYRKLNEGLFFTVPGINKFGDTVINRLLDDSEKRRIHIDLKHTDVIGRRFLLDKYEELGIPPICSHCAVTGFSIDYSSPFLNEYHLMKANISRDFYPFGINLFNEEIERICEMGGIIGIPLEERVLGGYINNRRVRPVSFREENDRLVEIRKTKRMSRTKYLNQILTFAKDSRWPEFAPVWSYYQQLTGITENPDSADSLALFDLIREEYCSAESFMKNVFHVTDIAKTLQDSSSRNQLTIREWLEKPWENICLGSDLDGLIDPINVCATASMYPEFKEKLRLFFPMFIKVRKQYELDDIFLGKYYDYNDYFVSGEFEVSDALDMIFYNNLKEFTISHMKQ